MKSPEDLVNIYNYFDYREYLSDVFGNLKKSRKAYSYRTFAREAGVSSHNFLPRILKRERNLSREFIPLLSRYLTLKNKEIKYFQTLVSFNNARRPSIKEKHLKQLLSLRVASEEHKIKDKKLLFFAKWYYPIIRELVSICDFQEDYALLARNCIPRITPVQAKSAVAFLLKNGFIKRENNGRYMPVNAIIATEPEVDSAIIPKYHKVTIGQCAKAVETIKKENRNFTSSTLLVSKKMYEEIKQEIHHFRKRLLAKAKECKNPDMVCFAGFQLLPRSEQQTSTKTVKGKRGV